MKKIGIITFHNSYNCGSMMESYAICKYLNNKGFDAEIIDYSSDGQIELYSVFSKNNSIKKIIKNILLFPFRKRIQHNNELYEKFKNDNFKLSEKVINEEFDIDKYDILVAGSDQIWNITIPDASDYYFLPWKTDKKKIAYAPSFGARNIKDYSKDVNKYIDYLNDFDALSIRENNGKKWLDELTNSDVKVLIDPTLLLDKSEYDKIADNNFKKKKYIFYYNPSYSKNACEFVKKIADKYGLEVYCWSTKSYYIKTVWKYGFKLVEEESPAIYLNYIKNADLVITGSFHGTIFSTIYRKNFYSIYDTTYGNDDRSLTLVNELGISDRYIDCVFDKDKDYLENVDYSEYEKNLPSLRKEADEFLNDSLK